MNEKTLVICDKEARYAKGLGDNLSDRNEFVFKVYAFTDLKHINNFLEKHKVDVLLIDEVFTREERKSFEAEQNFVLTKESCKDLDENEVEILKYQCADAILAEVLETYLRKSNVTILKKFKKQSKKIIAVYSPIHRIGKTTFAMALCKELSKEKKTLYLNLEGYSGFREEAKNLGDLFYYFRQEQEELGTRLSMLVRKKDSVEYIAPMPMITDLKEINVNEWKQLLQRILDESVYENVVLDLDECVDGLFEILQLCDWVYMPVLDEEVSHRKVCGFEEGLVRLHVDEILRKTTRFVVKDNMEEYARKIVKEEEV